MLGLLVTRGWPACRRLVVHYVVVFGGLGAVYFFWRWSYFGYPLPNPFYVKGGGSLYPSSLLESIRNVSRLSGPFLPILLFAWRVAMFVKSNAIVYARGLHTIGVGAGQMSRVDAAHLAAHKAKAAGFKLADLVLASDAFFPFPDGVETAAAAVANDAAFQQVAHAEQAGEVHQH